MPAVAVTYLTTQPALIRSIYPSQCSYKGWPSHRWHRLDRGRAPPWADGRIHPQNSPVTKTVAEIFTSKYSSFLLYHRQFLIINYLREANWQENKSLYWGSYFINFCTGAGIVFCTLYCVASNLASRNQVNIPSILYLNDNFTVHEEYWPCLKYWGFLRQGDNMRDRTPTSSSVTKRTERPFAITRNLEKPLKISRSVRSHRLRHCQQL